MMFQTGLAKFDKKTKTFQLFPIPPGLDNDAAQQSMVMPRASNVDGKVWTNEVAKQSIMRLDLKTGISTSIRPQLGAEGTALRSRWDIPFIISPHSHTRLYIAGNPLSDEAKTKQLAELKKIGVRVEDVK